MIEKYLIDSGLGCGTVKNFNNEIIKNVKLKISPRWYFKTPIKVSGHGLKTATIDFAFPFVAKKDEVNEKAVLERLEITRKEYEDDLIFHLRKHRFIVPPDTAIFTIIPFWANETSPRDERKDFVQLRLHILNAVITVKYRNLELSEPVDPVLFALQKDQSELETRIDTLTIYVGGADFQLLSEAEQLVLTDQLSAMNTYNYCLKERILNY